MDGFDENDPIMQEQQRLDELRTAAVLVKAAIDDMSKTQKVSLFSIRSLTLLRNAAHGRICR